MWRTPTHSHRLWQQSGVCVCVCMGPRARACKDSVSCVYKIWQRWRKRSFLRWSFQCNTVDMPQPQRILNGGLMKMKLGILLWLSSKATPNYWCCWIHDRDELVKGFCGLMAHRDSQSALSQGMSCGVFHQVSSHLLSPHHIICSFQS